MTTACAPGKIILLGEHAVVYGRPALALPVRQIRACAHVNPAEIGSPGQIQVRAPSLGPPVWLEELPDDNPLAAICRATLRHLGHPNHPPLLLEIESTIPMASGLGSSAAVSVAVAKGLAAYFEVDVSADELSDLAFQVERLHHGTPSGIDNTVIAHDRPVYFVRDQALEPLAIGGTFHFLIGDTGIAAPTAEAVAEVRSGWQDSRGEFEALFDTIGDLVVAARNALIHGDPAALGSLMSQNHDLLVALGVSCPELDQLAEAACAAGAFGAKMSGGGKGGNMIAAVSADKADLVDAALRRAGAVTVLPTEVAP